ncbi:acyltransferase domain-containing protein [Vallitalea sp.]|uniref:acyltransferase domain-containing protein n=1 Tax=Vallitalea sp. TaxID=1882829 RepID=UPI0025FBD697|nr:acyltransferase domain-containing protein [Vallitalea sp.]MCT4687030.1 acyltransferase domain-containing protein [Vallitalea sp.]
MKNNQKKIFLFSGQGGQYFEMGKALYNENKIFKRYMDNLDEMIGEEINESIIEKLYYSGNTISNIFNRTLYTYPAIFMIQYALAKTP